ncbi:MAG TPA: GNAT family N-acetyltransferase [Bryobacteraceae bacterium]|jgi:phosphinothricin acetyltransferase
MTNLIIRPSEDRDTPSIAEIYAHYVRNSTATFESEPPDAGATGRRRAEVLARGLPWLVAEVENGTIAAYAYASSYRTREAYRFTVEDSIYLHRAYLGQGIGTALLPRLIESCQQAGARQMVAIIGGRENTASVRLHAKFGFRHVGVLEAVGFKFGRWIDTILMQRALGSGSAEEP